MQKAILRIITLMAMLVCLFISKLLIAQVPQVEKGFTWRLLEVADPTTGAKIKFIPLVDQPSKFKNWDFGDGNISSATDSLPTHTYATVDTFSVSYNFNINSKDSTITYKVFANSAAFIAHLDSNTNVTYVRILRSAFGFPENNTALLGNMRFEWTINGTILSDVSFTGAFGQYPNIRYTFDTPGPNTVSLRAWNITAPTKEITFTRIINIQPTFAAKEKIANIPNVFTPNGDNVYDYFEVQTSGLSRLVLKVFSRSGSLVYQKQANFVRWDGRNDNGKDLPKVSTTT